MYAGETITGATPQQTTAVAARIRSRGWMGWVPLILLPSLVITLRTKLLPWVFMWTLAAAIFLGCKWQTWWEARSTGRAANHWRRDAAYLLLWPGMEAQEFFADATEKRRISPREWLAGLRNALAGAALIWTGARVIALGHALLGGWAGMIGVVLVLHFGTFHLMALAWRRAGVRVKPIMQRPLMSRSLSELWGKRWNLGFRKLTHTWVFQPLSKRFGPMAGTLGAFFASGLLHDAVISIPSGAGYGLPSAYFLAQGIGVLVERSEIGKRCGLGQGARGWLWTALIAAGPLYWLFHPWFVMRVMVPFLRAVAG
jgi:membrane bound O-acyltransferase family protein